MNFVCSTYVIDNQTPGSAILGFEPALADGEAVLKPYKFKSAVITNAKLSGVSENGFIHILDDPDNNSAVEITSVTIEVDGSDVTYTTTDPSGAGMTLTPQVI